MNRRQASSGLVTGSSDEIDGDIQLAIRLPKLLGDSVTSLKDTTTNLGIKGFPVARYEIFSNRRAFGLKAVGGT